jgi:hypothetical protein
MSGALMHSPDLALGDAANLHHSTHSTRQQVPLRSHCCYSAACHSTLCVVHATNQRSHTAL